MDAHGASLYDGVRATAADRRAKALEALGIKVNA
jgi:hypothetical protein